MCPPLISSSASEDTYPMIKPFTHNLKTVFRLLFLFYKKNVFVFFNHTNW